MGDTKLSLLLSLLVLRVDCGICLYQFLIITFLFTLDGVANGVSYKRLEQKLPCCSYKAYLVFSYIS